MDDHEKKTLARNSSDIMIDRHDIYHFDKAEISELRKGLRICIDKLSQISGMSYNAMSNESDQRLEETRRQFYIEALEKLEQHTKIEDAAPQESIRLIKLNLVPFVNKQQVSWSDTFKDSETGKKTPTVIDMLISTCPCLLDIKSVIDSTRYVENLQKEYDNFECSYSYERTNLTPEQRRSAVERFGRLTIRLKRTLSPSS